MPHVARPVADRLYERVEILPWSGCWIYMGSTVKGYGVIGVGRGFQLKAHRVSWELANGRPIPRGLFVCHSCDVRPCINPAHLWLGTHLDNMTDAHKKGVYRVIAARQQAQTHCRAGHEYTAANTYVATTAARRGTRLCRACRRDFYARKRDMGITYRSSRKAA
jgi:hypothetical protein